MNEEAPGGGKPARPFLPIGPVGILAYCLYVAGGFFFGFSVFVAGAQQLSDFHLTLPFLGGPLAFPSFVLPQFAPSSLIFLPDWSGTDRVNVLVLGIDQREDERSLGVPTRSDVVMVASLNPADKSAALISFPRDLWVTIPGFGEERINVAYPDGEVAHVAGGGPALAAQTIQRNFGLATQYYVVVDFPAVEQIVNTVGGVVVDVPHPVKDDEYPTADYGLERVFILPGPQIMDGATALKYARTRHSDNDFARMRRQQQVVLALRDRALRLNILPRLPSLIDQTLHSVRTNLGPTDVLALAKLASQIDQSSIASLVVQGDLVTPHEGIGGASLQLPKTADIQRAIQRVLADPGVVAEAASLEIDATPTMAQIARQVADRLAGDGFQRPQQVTIREAPEVTRVSSLVDKPYSLTKVLGALGLGPESATTTATPDFKADIRIVLGRDFKLPDTR